MVNLKGLKAGAVIEARFNDTKNRSGIVIERHKTCKKPVEGQPFTMRVMFYMDESDSYMERTIESTQVVFVAPEIPNFASIIDHAKHLVMRWTCTIDGEESVALNFGAMVTVEDGFNLTSAEVAKLKSMQIGDSFVAGNEGQALIKRVA